MFTAVIRKMIEYEPGDGEGLSEKLSTSSKKNCLNMDTKKAMASYMKKGR